MGKGLSPTSALAILIIVLAVASAIIIAAVSTYSSRMFRSSIMVLPDSHITLRDGEASLTLYLVNLGINPIIIYKLEVDGSEFKMLRVDGERVEEAYIEADGRTHLIIAYTEKFKIKTPAAYKLTIYIRGFGRLEYIIEVREQ